MSELWQFFKQEYWDHFQENVVEKEFPKNLQFFSEIKVLLPFDEDINRALASLSPYMFKSDIINFIKWLDKKIPALDGMTPRQVSRHEKGMDWIREFLLRS